MRFVGHWGRMSTAMVMTGKIMVTELDPYNIFQEQFYRLFSGTISPSKVAEVQSFTFTRTKSPVFAVLQGNTMTLF